MVRKVACFFTGGFSESGAMQEFLHKINPNVVLKQFCPNKPLKRWIPGIPTSKQPKIQRQFSGLTGKDLISYVHHYIDNHIDEIRMYDAILIEDDLDARFYQEVVSGDPTSKRVAKTKEYNDYCNIVTTQIRKKLSKDDTFPVILLYASPEIEAWFWGDWENSFGYAYGPKSIGMLSREENQYFSNRFRTYLRNNVTKEYSNCIEYFGFFNGIYHKLSDKVIDSLEGGFKTALSEEENELAKNISKMKELKYSKMIDGDRMLRNLSGKVLKGQCPVFYSPAIREFEKLK